MRHLFGSAMKDVFRDMRASVRLDLSVTRDGDLDEEFRVVLSYRLGDTLDVLDDATAPVHDALVDLAFHWDLA